MKFGKKWNADNMTCKNVLLSLNLLQVAVLMESMHMNILEQTQQQPDYPLHVLPLLLQGCVVQGGVSMVFLVLSIHSGKGSLNVPFSSIIRFQSDYSSEGHGGQLQNCHSCVEMAVGLQFIACKYIIVRIKFCSMCH